MMNIRERNFNKEWDFSATRSSGPGGQHVNKVNTRVVLRFNINNSLLLEEHEKAIIRNKLLKKISKEGILQIVCQAGRSQYENREKAIDKFYQLLERALKPEKKRTPTKPTVASKIKRRIEKQLAARKKVLRKIQPEDF